MATKKQTDFAFHQLGQVLRDLEADLRWKLDGSVRIPQAWHELAQSRALPKRTKITLRLDDDVLAFFQTMGPGHTTRMNAVLRAFMLARLAEVVKDSVEYIVNPKDVEHRVRDEVWAVLRGQERAKEAAEARLAAGAADRARLKMLKPWWEEKTGG